MRLLSAQPLVDKDPIITNILLSEVRRNRVEKLNAFHFERLRVVVQDECYDQVSATEPLGLPVSLRSLRYQD